MKRQSSNTLTALTETLRVCLLRRYQDATTPSDEDLIIDEEIDAVERTERPGRFAAGVLLSYARRTATRALRGKEARLLERGLKAFALGGSVEDYRDLLSIAATIYDSGTRLGVDVIALFKKCRSDSSPAVRRALGAFIELEGQPLDLEKYQARLVIDANGETYIGV